MAIDRPDRVNDVGRGRDVKGWCEGGRSRGAAANGAAGGGELVHARGAKDGATDAASRTQLCVGRIHDRVCRHVGDVDLDNLNAAVLAHACASSVFCQARPSIANHPPDGLEAKRGTHGATKAGKDVVTTTSHIRAGRVAQSMGLARMTAAGKK